MKKEKRERNANDRRSLRQQLGSRTSRRRGTKNGQGATRPATALKRLIRRTT